MGSRRRGGRVCRLVGVTGGGLDVLAYIWMAGVWGDWDWGRGKGIPCQSLRSFRWSCTNIRWGVRFDTNFSPPVE